MAEVKKSKLKEENKNLSRELLESYKSALYKVKSFFDSVSSKEMELEDVDLVESILKLGEKLGKNIETLAILESKVERDEMESSKRRGGGKSSLFEND